MNKRLLFKVIAAKLKEYKDGIKHAKNDIALTGSPRVMNPRDGYSHAFCAGNNLIVRRHVGVSTKSMYKIDAGYETLNMYKLRKGAA